MNIGDISHVAGRLSIANPLRRMLSRRRRRKAIRDLQSMPLHLQRDIGWPDQIASAPGRNRMEDITHHEL